MLEQGLGPLVGGGNVGEGKGGHTLDDRERVCIVDGSGDCGILLEVGQSEGGRSFRFSRHFFYYYSDEKSLEEAEDEDEIEKKKRAEGDGFIMGRAGRAGRAG